eukprot:164999-Chlamydomonas_euryale.AAC.1
MRTRWEHQYGEPGAGESSMGCVTAKATRGRDGKRARSGTANATRGRDGKRAWGGTAKATRGRDGKRARSGTAKATR